MAWPAHPIFVACTIRQPSHSFYDVRTRSFFLLLRPLGRPTRKYLTYDNARKDSGFGNYRQEEPTSSPNDVTADWELVKKYRPEAEAWRVDLSELSQSLAFAFQVTVLEKKLGSNTHEIARVATNMKGEFPARYFGTNRDIQRFAQDALRKGRTDVAREVNRAMTAAATGHLSVGGVVSQVIAGGAGGAILTAIIGAIKNKVAAT